MTNNNQWLAAQRREAIDWLIEFLEEFIASDPEMIVENPGVYLEAQRQITELTTERRG